MHAHTHTGTHARTHARTHAHTHTHTHTHTECADRPVRSYLQLPVVLLMADNLRDSLTQLVLCGLQALLHQHQLLLMVGQLDTHTHTIIITIIIIIVIVIILILIIIIIKWICEVTLNTWLKRSVCK